MAKRDWATTFGRCCRFFDRRRMAAYGVGLGSVSLALALRLALEWVAPGIVPYATLYPALVAAALLGGVGPGWRLWCRGAGRLRFLLRQAGLLVPPPSAAAVNLALLVATGGVLIVLAAAFAGRSCGCWRARSGSSWRSARRGSARGISTVPPACVLVSGVSLHPGTRSLDSGRYRTVRGANSPRRPRRRQPALPRGSRSSQ